MALDIFIAILQGGDGNNDKQWQNDETGRDCREFVEELQNGDRKEEATNQATSGGSLKTNEMHVHVGYSPKLLQQVSGKKCDDRVLGSNDLVRNVDVFWLNTAFVVVIIGGEMLVDEDGPWRTWRPLPNEEGLHVEGGQPSVPRS